MHISTKNTYMSTFVPFAYIVYYHLNIWELVCINFEFPSTFWEIEYFSYIYCLVKKSCNDYNIVFYKHNDIFYNRACLQLCLLVINSSVHYQGNHNKSKMSFFICPFIGMLGFLHQNLSWQNVLIVEWLLFTNSFISCIKNRQEPWNT